MVDPPRDTLDTRTTRIHCSIFQDINHNPIDLGDNLPLPARAGWQTPDLVGLPDLARDTLRRSWTDPTVQVNLAQAQPFGLTPAVGRRRPGE